MSHLQEELFDDVTRPAEVQIRHPSRVRDIRTLDTNLAKKAKQQPCNRFSSHTEYGSRVEVGARGMFHSCCERTFYLPKHNYVEYLLQLFIKEVRGHVPQKSQEITALAQHRREVGFSNDEMHRQSGAIGTVRRRTFMAQAYVFDLPSLTRTPSRTSARWLLNSPRTSKCSLRSVARTLFRFKRGRQWRVKSGYVVVDFH